MMALDEFAYLNKVRLRLNKDPAFRRLGSADVKIALSIGDSARLVTFEAFEIASIGVLKDGDLRDAELVIRMSKRQWNAYLKKRKAGDGPTLLTLDLDRGVVEAQNPLARLKLARYNRTIQTFVDTCAKTAA